MLQRRVPVTAFMAKTAPAAMPVGSLSSAATSDRPMYTVRFQTTGLAYVSENGWYGKKFRRQSKRPSESRKSKRYGPFREAAATYTSSPLIAALLVRYVYPGSRRPRD